MENIGLKLLWSFVIIFALSLLAYVRYDSSSTIISFSIYPALVSPYVAALGILAFLLRIAKFVSEDAFICVLGALSGAYIGLVGLYIEMISQRPIALVIFMFLANLILSAILFFPVFRNKMLK
jgi:hypothetical protein